MMDSVNPLGTDGFEFVEYTAADEQGIASLKHLFTSLATHSLVAKLKRLLNSMALRYAVWRFA
ncbi:4-hydroxyphenylpyruvate dioxygenase [Vibrio cholerae]|nr:4-hydroxyphenylpyruvate dioxygenase [Vibrio cholerae]